MAEIITQLPGAGIVTRLTPSSVTEAAALTIATIEKYHSYGIPVGYISLAAEPQTVPADVHIIRQKNTYLGTVLLKCQGLQRRKFIRAIIIDGADRLRLKLAPHGSDEERAFIDRRLSQFAAQARVPVILINTPTQL
ncbi:MAG: hypothetical protein K6E37_06620 [Bacteroidales bacterium]|nr:hypothetical protein [Bacteroidales bacterium]